MMPACKPSLEYDAVEAVERRTFMAMEEQWNALVVATTNEPFYRHEFLRIWVSHFMPRARLEILTIRDGAGRLAAGLPLVKMRGFVCGVPTRLAVAPANSHSCRFDIIADDGAAAARALLSHLSADKTWDVIELTDVPENGNAWLLYSAAREAGFPVGAQESQQSPYLPLPQSYQEMERRMSTSFRANLRRRHRKLEAIGTVEFEHVTGGADLRSRLDECFAIEESGWKGRNGTAIVQDTRTRGFYTDLAMTAAARKYLSLFFLKLNGRSIAFHYGFTYAGVYYMPKLGYDEEFKGCSPGLVLLDEIIKDCIARGVRVYDFLGPALEWKTQWSHQVRRHSHLYIFRNSLFGQALRAAKFGLIPAAKRLLRPRMTRSGISA
jgi:CelD/BcsL family acetyltransferase involved in cellulose biosynthesis